MTMNNQNLNGKVLKFDKEYNEEISIFIRLNHDIVKVNITEYIKKYSNVKKVNKTFLANLYRSMPSTIDVKFDYKKKVYILKRSKDIIEAVKFAADLEEEKLLINKKKKEISKAAKLQQNKIEYLKNTICNDEILEEDYQ